MQRPFCFGSHKPTSALLTTMTIGRIAWAALAIGRRTSSEVTDMIQEHLGGTVTGDVTQRCFAFCNTPNNGFNVDDMQSLDAPEFLPAGASWAFQCHGNTYATSVAIPRSK